MFTDGVPTRPGHGGEPGMSPLLSLRAIATGLLLILFLGCSGSVDATPAGEDQVTRLQVGMASTDLAVGENRIAFGLLQPGYGPLKEARVQVGTYLIENDVQDGPRTTVDAVFQDWPGGAGGVYVALVSFDQAGEWGLRMDASLPDDSVLEGGTRVTVKQVGSTPPLGSFAPRSVHRTSADVDRLTDLTTDTDPDPDLYHQTIAEAVKEGKPLLVSFATPAYCRTATCGPQLGVIKDLKREFAGRINVIHIEVYDNPPEIRDQGIGVARLSPVISEWGLPTEPWTFVVDRDGIIRAKYEGFANANELRGDISEALRPGP